MARSTTIVPGDFMQAVSMVYPAAALVALTFLVSMRLLAVRNAAIRSGAVKMSYFRGLTGPEPPEHVAAAGRALANLFEVPPLFYAVCIAVIATGAVDGLFVALAWAFVAARAVQAGIHLSYNNVLHRFAAYITGWLILLALWGRLVLVLS